MNYKNWRKWAYFLTMIGCAQFVILTFIGMLFYAGGTYIDPNSPGYSFFLNFFSDIGRTIAHSGDSNLIAYILFSIAFFSVGITLIPSFLAFPKFFSGTKIIKWISIFGTVLGILTAFCFSGITFAPSDVNPALHILFVYTGFLSGFFVSFLYSIVIFLHKTYPKRYGFNFLIFTVVLALYLILLFGGPSGSITIGLIVQVTGQKIVLYTFALSLFIHSYGAWKLEKDKDNNNLLR